ncbi:MAG: type II toxin-antitoxin system VapC family toxin [Actinomycetota bacterium]
MTPGSTVVLDASAVLALLHEEAGADEVEPLLDGALMSSVNLSEVIQKAEQHGANTEGLEYDLEALGIAFRDFDVATARPAAELWSLGSGLSFGDRACVALAQVAGATVVTADRRWKPTKLPVEVRFVR